MARDGDKSSKRRWGRGGKPEEGPTDEELGWLADLREARESTGPFGAARDPGPPPAPPGAPASAPGPPPGAEKQRRRLGGGRGTPPAAPPPPAVPPPLSPPGPAGAPRAAPPRAGGSKAGGSKAGPPPAAPPPVAPPPVVPPSPVPPPASAPKPPSRLRRGQPEPAWRDLTGEVPEQPPPTRSRLGRLGRAAADRVAAAETAETPRLSAGVLGPGAPAPPAAPGAPPRGKPGRPAAPAKPGATSPAGPTVGPPSGVTLPGGPPTGVSLPGGPPAVKPGGPMPGGPMPTGLIPVGPKPGGPKPGGPGPLGPVGPPSADAIRQRRAELRRQLRLAQRLKTLTLFTVVLLMLAAYPLFLVARQASQDPVFVGLDSLKLPAWAAGEKSDASGGSRWCIGSCRFRERTWQSARPPEETQAAYEKALRGYGWRPRVGGICPAAADGVVTCWYHDEYLLDMWVRAPVCETPPARPAPSGTAQPAQPTTPPCPGAFVTVKVFNSVGYQPGE